MLRTRRRRLLVVAALLAVVAGWWWASRSAPLTAEERPFVGWWTTGATGPLPGTSSPARFTAFEYRADRSMRVRWENAHTGEVGFIVVDRSWRAANGHLTYIDPLPPQDVVGGLRRGGIRLHREQVFAFDWDGPDRFRFERIDPRAGVGRGTWPADTRLRCDPPADAP